MPFSPNPVALISLAAGLLVLLTTWLPLLVRKLPLSLPIFAVGIGYVTLRSDWMEQLTQLLFKTSGLEHLLEFVILIALMGIGLRIERPFAWAKWSATWRLLLIAMPLTIVAMALLCRTWLGLSWGAALLIGAALAPTDPVLAADVQIGRPGEQEGGETRFALSSEAGLNDGLAFPFVILAMLLVSTPFEAGWVHWMLVDVLWKISAGCLVGYLSGRLFGWLTFRLPRLQLLKTGDGLVAVGVTLISYGLTELAHGYGFIAVFIAAMTLRATDRGHNFHADMADFLEQVERLLMVIVLVMFGGAIGFGALHAIGWKEILTGLVLLLIIRPVAGWLCLVGASQSLVARALIAFFGIRGLGSFYYMAYATNRTEFDDAPRLWGVVSFVVLVSILMHGITSTPLMDWVDRRRQARAEGLSPPPFIQ